MDNPNARRPVTICADDYGLTEGISRGIRELAAGGRLSATGAIVTRERWPADAAALRPLDGRIDIGLHFNLTLGTPLGPMPVLAPEGVLPPIGTIVRRALTRRLDRGELAAEAARQLGAFVRHFGRAPDFVDGHQHVHALPMVREALLDALDDLPAAASPWLRDPADRYARILRRGRFAKKALAVAALGAGFGAAARARGHATNDGFAGFSDFDPSADFGAVMQAALIAPGPRHLVMVHPGHVDAELRGLDPAVESRALELAYLGGAGFERALAAAGCRVARIGGGEA
jgi:predicted glycoside hydrolase/deacetylase ChbG (UPF0249 family)